MSNLPSLANQAALPEGILESYDRMKVEAGWIALDGFSAIRFTGDDRKGWLQGQVTNNLRTFEAGNATAFCLCQPTGQLLAVCDAWAFADEIILTTETQCVAEVLKRVDTMVIVENVEAEPVSPELDLLTIQGPMATQMLGQILDLPALDAGKATLADSEVYVMRSNRTGMGGWDLLLPSSSRKARNLIAKTFGALDPVAFEIARVEAGIPRFGRDMGERTLPPEMGAPFESRHISYNKGCYTGQEVLMRMHSRGHANKSWVCLESEQGLEVGQTLRHPNRADAGTVTSVANSPDYGYLAAAMVRKEVAFLGETVEVSTANGPVQATIRNFPLQSLA